MKIKLLSSWFGSWPTWIDKYREQMARFECVDWELYPAVEGSDTRLQLREYNALMTERLGTLVNKTLQSICDVRPFWGHAFAEKYEGYDFWGWCDMDMRFGDLDKFLPVLLDGNTEVLSFKDRYLSGCFAVFKNTKHTTQLYRLDPTWRDVLATPNYRCWDESGYRSDECMWKLILKHDLVVNRVPGLYTYSSATDKQRSHLVDGKTLIDPDTGKELVFHHFMDDVWPSTYDEDLR